MKRCFLLFRYKLFSTIWDRIFLMILIKVCFMLDQMFQFIFCCASKFWPAAGCSIESQTMPSTFAVALPGALAFWLTTCSSPSASLSTIIIYGYCGACGGLLSSAYLSLLAFLTYRAPTRAVHRIRRTIPYHIVLLFF